MASIQERRISDKILLAQELVRNYYRSDISPRCVIKIDLMKAFDSLNWNFLIHLLEAAEFPFTFINWVKSCITSTWFSISLNGSLAGIFKVQKGLQQGNPISPYLFVLAVEVLSQLLDRAAQEGRIGYHPRCKKLSLTHLCFVDDLLIFTDCDPSSFSAI